MSIIQIDYASLFDAIRQDNTEKRFNTKIFLVNNFNTYFKLVEDLENMADLSLHISDPAFCMSDDTVPDLKKVLSVLEENKDKNILITSVGEYLRLCGIVEKNVRSLFSIINYQAFSRKRVWIPIFAAKDEFLSYVGDLEEEHYPDVIYEIESSPSTFSATAFADKFSDTINAKGLRNWIKLWDDKAVKSGMSFSSKRINQFKERDGIYCLTVISDPFKYFQSKVLLEEKVVDRSLGSDEQWLSLVSQVTSSTRKLSEVIKRSLNVVDFDWPQILSSWSTLSDEKKWAFWLWYKLGFNTETDYISFSVIRSDSFAEIDKNIEIAILDCLNNPNVDEWIAQRTNAMQCLGRKNSVEFWRIFDSMSEPRKQLKLLSGKNLDEKQKIIEIISASMNSGQSLSEYKTILSEKYPDLISYLADPKYFDSELSAYMTQYKKLKVSDSFSIAFSNSAESINIYNYDTRSQILQKIKTSGEAYYLWIDGMGVEWTDLLIQKIEEVDKKFTSPEVEIGSAVIPTVTEVNMKCADPETVSEKVNDLDSIGHIKDKSKCNYFYIIAEQIDFIGKIASDIVAIAHANPGKDIVITADHGMSRMAAKGFHETEAVKITKNAEVGSLGRYCVIPEGFSVPDVSHTLKDERVIAFKTHAHFVSGGNAPGEIHGGATPEEILVPVIRYKQHKKQIFAPSIEGCSCSVEDSTVLKGTGICDIVVNTQGPVEKVTIEIKSMKYVAQKTKANEWTAQVPGLQLNNTYQISVYLNNIFTDETHDVYVKSAGLSFDDDF